MPDKTEVCNFFSIAVEACGSVRDGETAYRGSLGGQPTTGNSMRTLHPPRQTSRTTLDG